MREVRTTLRHIIIEIILVIMVGIFLPALFVKHYTWLVQGFIVFFMMMYFTYKHYNNLKRFMNEAIIKYNVDTDSEKLSLEESIKIMGKEFEYGQETVHRFSKINKTLNLAIEINNAMMTTVGSKHMYDLVLKKAMKAIDKSDKGSVMILNSKDALEFISLIGFESSFFDFNIPKVDTFLYKLSNGLLDKSVIVKNVVEFNRKYMKPDEFEEFYRKYPMAYQTTLSVPIRCDEEFIGVINLDSNHEDGFTDEDVAIMDLFASQLEIIIRNQNLMNKNLYLSKFDHLTGAYNRSYFEEVIKSLIEEKHTSFAFIVMDINDLKLVNDKYGHMAGDALLSHFSEAVRMSIRLTDHFARIGGDEFILLLNEFSKLETTKVFIRIMNHLNQVVSENDLRYKISFSYGITIFPNEADNYDTLYLMSDQKMYDMKRKYREEI